MPGPSQRSELARYSCQIWRRHFANADWFQTLEDTAFETLAGRTLVVREFWLESTLGEVQCEVRFLTEEEANWNGRPFAQQAYLCLDFVLTDVDREGLRARLAKQNDFSDPTDVDDLIEYAIAVELETFCDIVIFLSNVAFCGVLGSEAKTVSAADRVLVRSHRGQTGLPRSADD